MRGSTAGLAEGTIVREVIFYLFWISFFICFGDSNINLINQLLFLEIYSFF